MDKIIGNCELNKSEMIRDAIRHLIEEEDKLSVETLKVIEKGKK